MLKYLNPPKTFIDPSYVMEQNKANWRKITQKPHVEPPLGLSRPPTLLAIRTFKSKEVQKYTAEAITIKIQTKYRQLRRLDRFAALVESAERRKRARMRWLIRSWLRAWKLNNFRRILIQREGTRCFMLFLSRQLKVVRDERRADAHRNAKVFGAIFQLFHLRDEMRAKAVKFADDSTKKFLRNIVLYQRAVAKYQARLRRYIIWWNQYYEKEVDLAVLLPKAAVDDANKTPFAAEFIQDMHIKAAVVVKLRGQCDMLLVRSAFDIFKFKLEEAKKEVLQTNDAKLKVMRHYLRIWIEKAQSRHLTMLYYLRRWQKTNKVSRNENDMEQAFKRLMMRQQKRRGLNAFLENHNTSCMARCLMAAISTPIKRALMQTLILLYYQWLKIENNVCIINRNKIEGDNQPLSKSQSQEIIKISIDSTTKEMLEETQQKLAVFQCFQRFKQERSYANAFLRGVLIHKVLLRENTLRLCLNRWKAYAIEQSEVRKDGTVAPPIRSEDYESDINEQQINFLFSQRLPLQLNALSHIGTNSRTIFLSLNNNVPFISKQLSIIFKLNMTQLREIVEDCDIFTIFTMFRTRYCNIITPSFSSKVPILKSFLGQLKPDHALQCISAIRKVFGEIIRWPQEQQRQMILFPGRREEYDTMKPRHNFILPFAPSFQYQNVKPGLEFIATIIKDMCQQKTFKIKIATEEPEIGQLTDGDRQALNQQIFSFKSQLSKLDLVQLEMLILRLKPQFSINFPSIIMQVTHTLARYVLNPKDPIYELYRTGAFEFNIFNDPSSLLLVQNPQIEQLNAKFQKQDYSFIARAQLKAIQSQDKAQISSTVPLAINLAIRQRQLRKKDISGVALNNMVIDVPQIQHASPRIALNNISAEDSVDQEQEINIPTEPLRTGRKMEMQPKTSARKLIEKMRKKQQVKIEQQIDRFEQSEDEIPTNRSKKPESNQKEQRNDKSSDMSDDKQVKQQENSESPTSLTDVLKRKDSEVAEKQLEKTISRAEMLSRKQKILKDAPVAEEPIYLEEPIVDEVVVKKKKKSKNQVKVPNDEATNEKKTSRPPKIAAKSKATVETKDVVKPDSLKPKKLDLSQKAKPDTNLKQIHSENEGVTTQQSDEDQQQLAGKQHKKSISNQKNISMNQGEQVSLEPLTTPRPKLILAPSPKNSALKSKENDVEPKLTSRKKKEVDIEPKLSSRKKLADSDPDKKVVKNTIKTETVKKIQKAESPQNEAQTIIVTKKKEKILTDAELAVQENRKKQQQELLEKLRERKQKSPKLEIVKEKKKRQSAHEQTRSAVKLPLKIDDDRPNLDDLDIFKIAQTLKANQVLHQEITSELKSLNERFSEVVPMNSLTQLHPLQIAEIASDKESSPRIPSSHSEIQRQESEENRLRQAQIKKELAAKKLEEEKRKLNEYLTTLVRQRVQKFTYEPNIKPNIHTLLEKTVIKRKDTIEPIQSPSMIPPSLNSGEQSLPLPLQFNGKAKNTPRLNRNERMLQELLKPQLLSARSEPQERDRQMIVNMNIINVSQEFPERVEKEFNENQLVETKQVRSLLLQRQRKQRIAQLLANLHTIEKIDAPGSDGKIIKKPQSPAIHDSDLMKELCQLRSEPQIARYSVLQCVDQNELLRKISDFIQVARDTTDRSQAYEECAAKSRIILEGISNLLEMKPIDKRALPIINLLFKKPEDIKNTIQNSFKKLQGVLLYRNRPNGLDIDYEEVFVDGIVNLLSAVMIKAGTLFNNIVQILNTSPEEALEEVKQSQVDFSPRVVAGSALTKFRRGLHISATIQHEIMPEPDLDNLKIVGQVRSNSRRLIANSFRRGRIQQMLIPNVSLAEEGTIIPISPVTQTLSIEQAMQVVVLSNKQEHYANHTHQQYDIPAEGIRGRNILKPLQPMPKIPKASTAQTINVQQLYK